METQFVKIVCGEIPPLNLDELLRLSEFATIFMDPILIHDY